jgi:hypothetical protein
MAFYIIAFFWGGVLAVCVFHTLISTLRWTGFRATFFLGNYNFGMEEGGEYDDGKTWDKREATGWLCICILVLVMS